MISRVKANAFNQNYLQIIPLMAYIRYHCQPCNLKLEAKIMSWIIRT